MTKTMTGYVDLDDGELYYEMAGDGDILVLGHAGFVDSRMWDAQWDAFSRSIGSFALTCEGTGNRIQLQGQELGVMTSSRSEEHTSELQSRFDLVCRLLLEKKK